MASHVLRQRAEYANMRNAYESDRSHLSNTSSEGSTSYRQRASDSDRSYQTATTTDSEELPPTRPVLRHHETCHGRIERHPVRFFPEKEPLASPQTSVETYASTRPSEEALADDLDEFELPEYTARQYDAVIPATPSDFSELFPSHRRLAIRHDDSTLDGNMNLRVDTEVHTSRRACDMTLFHLRMHDLKEREFSLRRYCRDSGREVCHSVLKSQKPAAEKRPGFQRSLSNAFNSMLPRSDSRTPTMSSLKRNDSGYGSMHSVVSDDEPISIHEEPRPEQHMSHIIKMEFSNYAQVEVKRVGAKAGKRYEFDYWGVNYAWKRVVQKKHDRDEVSFHLVRAGSEQVLAYIMPMTLSRAEALEEEDKGGWIAPCSMWIADERIVMSQKDVSDVIVSAGLMALVDNTIRDRFHAKQPKQFSLPKVEYVGPKRLLSEMLRSGRSHSYTSRPSTAHGCPTGSRMHSEAVRQSSYDS